MCVPSLRKKNAKYGTITLNNAKLRSLKPMNVVSITFDSKLQWTRQEVAASEPVRSATKQFCKFKRQ